MARPKFRSVSFNKERLKGLTLSQFRKRFRKPYGEAGLDLTEEYYQLFPERRPAKKQSKTESEG